MVLSSEDQTFVREDRVPLQLDFYPIVLIWWLSSKPGHNSTTAAKPRRLPKAESTCSSKPALIFALSDVSRRLHCSSTAVGPTPRRLRVGPSLWLNVTAISVYK